MLDGDIQTMLYTVFLFIIFTFVMNKVLYKPLMRFMEQRDEMVQNDEDFIKSSTNVINECEVEIRSILDKARAESYQIRQELSEKYKNKYNEAIFIEKGKLDKDFSDFLSKLEDDRVEFESKLMSDIESYRQSFRESVNKF